MSARRNGIPVVLGILATLAILFLPGLPAKAQLDTAPPATLPKVAVAQVTVPQVTIPAVPALPPVMVPTTQHDGATRLDGSLSASAEREPKSGNRPKSDGVLSALVVLMLGLVVLVTAIVGARRSSR